MNIEHCLKNRFACSLDNCTKCRAFNGIDAMKTRQKNAMKKSQDTRNEQTEKAQTPQ